MLVERLDKRDVSVVAFESRHNLGHRQDRPEVHLEVPHDRQDPNVGLLANKHPLLDRRLFAGDHDRRDLPPFQLGIA